MSHHRVRGLAGLLGLSEGNASQLQPAGAELQTSDGDPVTGHFTTYTLGFVAFQVLTVDYVAAEQHGARSWNSNPPESLQEALPTIWPRRSEALPVAWPPPAFPYDD